MGSYFCNVGQSYIFLNLQNIKQQNAYLLVFRVGFNSIIFFIFFLAWCKNKISVTSVISVIFMQALRMIPK